MSDWHEIIIPKYERNVVYSDYDLYIGYFVGINNEDEVIMHPHCDGNIESPEAFRATLPLTILKL